MEYNHLAKAVMVLVTQGFLGSYVMLLIDFRSPTKKWRTLWIACAAVIVFCNVYMILFHDFWPMYKRVGVLTVTLPYMLITLICSRYKGLRVLFSICTCLWLGCVGNAFAMMTGVAINDDSSSYVIVRAISYLGLYIVLRLIRPHYMDMLGILDRGWGVLCLIPTVSFLTTLYIVNNIYMEQPLNAAVAIFGVSMVCTCAYILMYLFFGVVLRERELQNSRDLMSAQIMAMERQTEINHDAEETIRIQRHDMRHKWTTLSALVEQGDKKAILNFIGFAQGQLDEISAVRWCKNSVLNAVFSTYFSRAERENIQIDAKLSISENLHVNSMELSIVFANLLDNAINACTAIQPAERRKITCQCIESPRLMLRVSNPYDGEISFDHDGLPVASEVNHGIGTRSIVAFCEKYNAAYEYTADNGLFNVRIAF